jgi:PadR family transcriptional regulator AphA
LASKGSPPPLTSTSYAILGLLALRPWTTYELAKQMERAMGEFWPRAESKLYEEPKKLVAHGLATATKERVGARPRTVYSITAKGRKAMAAWIPTPAAGPVLEFEALLKVFFAEHGTKADLLAAIATTRAWVDERYRRAEGVPDGYLAGEGPFPERLPWLILTGQLLQEWIDAVDRWSAWAQATVESWPEDLRAAPPDLEVLAEQVRKAAQHRATTAADRRT